MRSRFGAWFIALLTLAGCSSSSESDVALGTLERDRLELPAEANEPIIEVMVHEGETVVGGQGLLKLDSAHAAARRAGLQAGVGVARHRLTELVHGPRTEEVLEARARLEAAESQLQTELNEYLRVRELVERKLTSRSALDRQRAARDRAEAERKAAQAELALLLKGTRIEELDQARAALQQTEAELAQFEITAERLFVRAPRAGVVEALPFKLGERPPAGAAVVVMLADGAPYARVYVPEPLRVGVTAGLSARVRVDRSTIRMLCGLLRPTAGSVQVLGYDVARDVEKLRPKLGYMTQRFSLWEDLTVMENLLFIAEVYGLDHPERTKRIKARLAEYHLLDRVEQRAGTLSGGQKQRLALAAATLHEPELLLLDEPTSAVDPQSRRDFWESLFRLVNHGTTILVSTHYMDEAERCHQLAILDEGRIVAEGAPKTLMAGIDAAVVEVETESIEAARAALAHLPEVESIAQLGTRLRVLLARSAEDPVAIVMRALANAGVTAHVQQTSASLEDVFVAVTGAARRGRPSLQASSEVRL